MNGARSKHYFARAQCHSVEGGWGAMLPNKVPSPTPKKNLPQKQQHKGGQFWPSGIWIWPL